MKKGEEKKRIEKKGEEKVVKTTYANLVVIYSIIFKD